MNRVAAVLPVLLFGCSSVPAASEIIANTRQQKSYHARFKSVFMINPRFQIECSGSSVCLASGVVYTHYKLTGGEEKNVVRAGDQVWVYSPIMSGWETAKEVGLGDAKNGIYDIDCVLALVEAHKAEAEYRDTESFELTIKGSEVATLVNGTMVMGSKGVKLNDSSARISMTFDGDRRLKSLSYEATFNLGGRSGKAEVHTDILSYNQVDSLWFLDDRKRFIPLSQTILDAIKRSERPK